MEPVTVASYILLGALALFAVVVGGKKLIENEVEASRARKIRERMRQEKLAKDRQKRAELREKHPVSSSGDDSVYVAALAAAGLDPDPGTSGGGNDGGGGDSSGGSDGGGSGGGE